MVGRSGERNQGSARFAAAIKGLSFLGIDPGETRQMCGIGGDSVLAPGCRLRTRSSHASMNFSVTVDQTGRGYRLPTTNGLSSSIAAWRSLKPGVWTTMRSRAPNWQLSGAILSTRSDTSSSTGGRCITMFPAGRVQRALDGFIASVDQPTIDGLNTYLVSQAAAASINSSRPIRDVTWSVRNAFAAASSKSG